MGSDGAHLGVSAGEALKTIIGGEPEPPGISMRDLEERIRSRPLPGDGKPPYEMEDLDEAYSVASEIMAHAFLVLADERPELLTEVRYYDGSEMDDRGEDDAKWWRERMTGKAKDPTTVMWEAYMERWPDGDEWIGGASGYMVGWSFNAVRAIKGVEPAPNPALMTVEDRS